jgi:hypothetical protein
MEIKIARITELWNSPKTDDDEIDPINTFLGTAENFSELKYREKLDPTNGWAVPFVTKEMYNVHWRFGLDFKNINVWQSNQWQEDDEKIILCFNHTDTRESVYTYPTGSNKDNALARFNVTADNNGVWDWAEIEDLHFGQAFHD